jgi:hypothetical protein
MLLKALALTVLGGSLLISTALPDLAIGTAAPAVNVKLKDVVGGERSLKDIASDNGLLVIFSCNTCPFVIGHDDSEGWQKRYPGLAKLCALDKIGFALVNSNDGKREAGDGFIDMQKQYEVQNYGGHYLLDQGHVLADAFGARTTPHVFLFDKDLKLVYKGAIDDNVDDPQAVKQPYLRNAIAALMKGEHADPATTRNIGCGIKRAAPEQY